MQEKIIDRTNSSPCDKSRTLARVSATEAKRFLTELANLRDDHTARERLKRRFPDLLPKPSEMPRLIEELFRATGEDGLIITGEAPRSRLNEEFALEALARLLGKPVSVTQIPMPSDVDTTDWWLGWSGSLVSLIWDTPDLRTKESMILRLLRMAPDSGLWLLRPTSYYSPSPFEQVITFFFKSADRARHCGNPDCPAPYFFAKRRSQKYCSDACALPSQREFKRRWWAEHGEARRKASAKKSRRKRGN